MIIRTKKIKVHHRNHKNHGSDNWKAAARNPVEGRGMSNRLKPLSEFNIQFVRSYLKEDGGKLLMKDLTKIPISRQNRIVVKEAFNNSI